MPGRQSDRITAIARIIGDTPKWYQADGQPSPVIKDQGANILEWKQA
jgi:hypothetical protein